MMSEDEDRKQADARLVLRWPWLTLLMMLALGASYWWMVQKAGGYGPYDATLLTELGANVAPLSVTGDYARLWTSLFLHESWGHLLQNLLVLLIVGATLETLASRVFWLFVYCAGGLFAAWMSAVWHFDYSVVSILGNVRQVVYVSVGASGAILALAGAELALAVRAYMRPDKTERQGRLLRGALIVPVMTLFVGLFEDGVDNAAHFAGFGFGLLAGLVAAVWQGARGRLFPGVASLAALAVVGWGMWASKAYVQAHPERDELRQLAIDIQEEEMRALHHARRLKSELQDLPPAAAPEEARGIVIDVPFVGRIVPAEQPGRVHMLKNYDEAEVVEYDLEAGKVVSTWLKQDYPAGKVWGCPGEQCYGIGVSDMALAPEQPGKAFFGNLVPGHVSRVDIETGETDFSVRTGSFPVRLLAHEGRLYAHDRVDATLTVLDAQDGEVVQAFALEGLERDPYLWPEGDTMALSQDGKRLYLLSRAGKAHVLDIEAGRVSPWEPPARADAESPAYLHAPDGLRRIGRDGSGNVWVLHPDGVAYPDGHAPRRHVHYKLSRFSSPTPVNIRDTFIDPDGDKGLILFFVDNYVLASSAQTGQLLRVYPLAFNASTLLVLDVLDNGRFYVAGREGAQIFDMDKALHVDPIATEYRQMLEKQRKR